MIEILSAKHYRKCKFCGISALKIDLRLIYYTTTQEKGIVACKDCVIDELEVGNYISECTRYD